VRVLRLDDAAQIAAGASGNHTCAWQMGGIVVCWGDNGQGQLGDGTMTMQTEPVAVAGGLDSVTDLTAGAAHTCAVRGGDTVFCWGDGASGQLGNDATVDSPTPVMVVGLGLAAQLAAGTQHTCVRRTDGAVLCWGSNIAGQLGTGGDTDSRTPVAVRTLPL
jgi:alpha-tubulin suppressor-like RCC1 family protein